MKTETTKRMFVFALGIVYLIALTLYAQGQVVPNGATLTSVSNDSGPSSSADSRSDAGGTINTITLDSTQQNGGWKAYVGNVSGTLTLRNSASQAIYTWPSQTAISGEVYVSRNSTVNWTSTACATDANVDNEQLTIGGLSSDSDSINNTYNYTNHTGFSVGSAATISASTCKTVYTYVNGADQATGTGSENYNFTGVALQDSSGRIVYTTPTVSGGATGFDTNLQDFQVIVPDEDGAPSTTYYFYLDIT